MVNKCKTCGDKIWHFSPSQSYCSLACQEWTKKYKLNTEELFNMFLNKK